MQCVGFIMDGNRRWAKEQGLSTLEGHQKGGEVFADSIHWVRDAGIPHAVYYAFSTENWKRTKEEVDYLMGLFGVWLERIDRQLTDDAEFPFKVRVIGRRADFTEDIKQKIEALETKSAARADAAVTVWVALSYGGRAEILTAVNEAVRRGELVDEENFSQLLWTAGMPDPDIIIRTGGEHRSSNFLPWQTVYSEYFFLDKYWPALTKADFEGILMRYATRERRKGT